MLFGVETLLWPTAARKSGEWHGGVVEVADCVMARRHRGEPEKSWLRHTAEAAKSGGKKEGEWGAAVLIPLLTNAEIKQQILWQGTGSTNVWILCYCCPEL